MPAILSRLVFDPKLSKLRYRCAIAMYAAIVAMGSIPGARAQIGHYATGLVLHSTAYGVLTVLLFTGGSGSARERAVKAVLTVMAMGACDELVQSFLTYRHADVHDWMVDTTSAFVVAGLSWAFLRPPASELT